MPLVLSKPTFLHSSLGDAIINTSCSRFSSSAKRRVRFASPRFQPLALSPILRLPSSARKPQNPTLQRSYFCEASSSSFSAVSSPEGREAVNYEEETAVDLPEDYDDDDDEEEGSAWEGAIVYKRNSLVSHVEYCTTLERLGLEKVSSDLSRSRASSMGLRLTPRAAKEYGAGGTPVLVSVDVTTGKKRSPIRLDGIVRTVLALNCNWCGKAAAESVFLNFSLLLTEECIKEPEVMNMGVMYGDTKSKPSADLMESEDKDGDDIDWEDRLYFPVEMKEIDISKHIRDLIHLEITIDAICDSQCKGVCLKCGINLNSESCNCSEESRVDEVGSGPLRNLREKVQRKRV